MQADRIGGTASEASILSRVSQGRKVFFDHNLRIQVTGTYCPCEKGVA
jgi:hypothetical protein